jgi:hypothetical protein
MKIKPIAKYHIQTSEEIRRIVVALAAEYDTFPSETVSAIRDELEGAFYCRASERFQVPGKS